MKGNLYLRRYAYPESFFKLEGLLGADMLVVIPCFDELDLIMTLDSLCEASIPDSCLVRVMIVINHGEDADNRIKKRNESTHIKFNEWVEKVEITNLSFHCALTELPQKHAGVGLARKIGMDDAVRAFDLSGNDGVIVCLDADCTVSNNYFDELWNTFQDNKVNSTSLYFEHGIDLLRTDENPEGITLYEIYLRYYIDALRYAGYPHAVQTIGSAMAVRSSTYQKCGGMNRRKAGEDFYFIHKLLPLGGYAEINSTTVRPSGRVSSRVPFGTGAAIGKWTQDASTLDTIYNPGIFEDLKLFIDSLEDLFDLPEGEHTDLINDFPTSIRLFLELDNGVRSILEIKAKTNTASSFRKQIWNYFDGLKVLKYVHYVSEHNMPKVPIAEGLAWLFNNHYYQDKPATLVAALLALREFDRANEVRIDL